MRRALLLGVLCGTVATSPLWAQTDTPTDTPTVTVTPTRTPTATATCAGTRVSFPILNSAFDGYAHGTRALYAPNSCQSVNTTSDMQVQRSKITSTRYDTDVAIICFNTNSLGAGASVLEAKINLVTGMFGNADHRNLVGQWLPPTAFPISCADWASTASSTAFSLPVDGLHVVKDVIDPALTNASTNVNRFGNTCLRIAIDGGIPIGVNRVDLVSFDSSGGPGPGNPTMDICYTTAPTPTGVLATSTPTATPTPLWINHYGSGNADIGYAVTVTDGAGNPYLGGFYGGTISFGVPTPLTTTGTDAFVAKFDPSGNLLWIQHTGNVASNTVLSLATDSGGNVYATGKFQNSLTWPGCATISSGLPSTYDIFLIKLASSDGTCQWAKSFGDAADDIGYGVAVDSGNNVVMTGVFVGRVSFGGAFLFSSGVSSGNSEYVAKFTSGGTHIWSHAFSQPPAPTNSGPDEGRALAIDSADNVWLTGFFRGTEWFDDVNPISSDNFSADIYLVKYTSAGTFVSVATFGGLSDDLGLSLAIDASTNVTIGGQFGGTVDFGGGNVVSTGPRSGIIVSFTAGGAWRWNQPITSTGQNAVFDVVADRTTGEVVSTGFFQNTVNFGGGNVPNAGSDDIFIAKYLSDGTYENVVTYGGPLGDQGQSVALDPIHNIYTTGYFQSTVNFGGRGPITSNGVTDIFLLKLDPPLDLLVFTATPTPLPTNTPTHTGSPTNTKTPMPTNTATISFTPTITPTPTVTPTKTPTPNVHQLLIQLKQIQLIPF